MPPRSTQAADPLDTIAWVLGLRSWVAGERVVVVGAGAASLVASLGRADGVAVTGLIGRPEAHAAPGRAVAVASSRAWPVRGASVEVAVVGPVEDLGGSLAELARALVPGGEALVVARGESHHRELDELVLAATGTGPARGPRSSAEAAEAALSEAGPALVVDGVARWSETVALDEPRALLRAVQALRPNLVGRLSGFTNWTTVMARAQARVEAAAAQRGGASITVDLTALHVRRGER
ncbi:MAG: hypothetical protein GEV08_06935 [Acidimicrobiia bacterium]|nr:hypothetical protein [Acidimicrobiia bacterium]